MDVWLAFGLFAACNLAALAGSTYLTLRNVPARVKQDARYALETAERLQADWTRTLVDLAALREAVEGTLQSVEYKRKSAAASASVITKKEKLAEAEAARVAEPAFDPTNTDHLRARARAKGMLAS